jgi:glutathione S-transferase
MPPATKPALRLLIGNKNYSSWSLRPWLLLQHARIPFVEEALSFNAPDFRERVTRFSPVGKVPVLVDEEEDLVVWDSLAICEYVAERHRHLQLWPVDPRARAMARSICAEMHSGFDDLRSNMPMNLTQRFPRLGWSVRVQRDIDRIVAIWTTARERFGQGGPFLFGSFSVADAYFAPVTRRFVTHEVTLPLPARQYVEAIERLPAMQQWIEDARRENDFVVVDEPYRLPPT